jgi:hypothetical protein
MRWEISGTDKAGGGKMKFVVDAPTEREALLEAKAKNVLVASVKKLGEPFAYAQRPVDPRAFASILISTATLNSVASVIRVVALLSFVVALAVLGITVMDAPDAKPGVVIDGLLMVFGVAMSGVICLATSALLKMIAAIGEAVRIIAMNSSRKPGEEPIQPDAPAVPRRRV